MNDRALDLTWDLRPDLVFLNHGSFGLAPRELLEWRFQLLREIERDPVSFLVDELPQRLNKSRLSLSSFLGTDPQQVAFVPSTTYGLNELLQRFDLEAELLPRGSEILMANHVYNATRNLVGFAATQRGWNLRVVDLPFPLVDQGQILDAFEEAWSDQTRLLIVDHISSPTSVVFPVQKLVALAHRRQALVIVDGAHAPGSIPLRLDQLQADAYVGNLHKWLCCPRGAAFLWVRQPFQQTLRPLVISHGANAVLTEGQSRFHQEHDWIGTSDPTPWLAFPQSLTLLSKQKSEWSPMALQAVTQRNRELLLHTQQRLSRLFPTPGISDELMGGLMSSVLLPLSCSSDGVQLQQQLMSQGIQVPVISLPTSAGQTLQFLRVSSFVYNNYQDIDALIINLKALLF